MPPMSIPTLILIALFPQAGGHTSLHPSGALAYVEMPAVQALREVYGETALGRLLADEDVHAALGKVMGQAVFDPRTPLARALAAPSVDAPGAPSWEELLGALTATSCSFHSRAGGFATFFANAAGLKRMAWDMRRLARLVVEQRERTGGLPESLAGLEGAPPELLVDPWGSAYILVGTDESPGFTLRSLGLDARLGGEGSGADLEFGLSTEATQIRLLAETFGAELVLEFDGEELSARAFEVLAAFAERGGVELERGILALPGGGECSSMRLADTSFGPIEIVHHGTRIVALLGMLERDALAERLSGTGSDAAGSDDAWYRAAAACFTAPAGVTVFRGYSQLATPLLALSEWPTPAPLLDVLEGLLGPAFAAVTRDGTWRVELREGVFVAEGLTSPMADDPFEGVLGGTKLDDVAFGLLNPAALAGWLTSFDVPRLVTAVRGLDVGGAGERALAALDETFGFRPDRDLALPLGGELALNLPPLRSVMSAPDVSLALSLRDREAFLRGMDGAVQYLLAEFGDDVKVDVVSYKGTRLYTFTATSLPFGAGALPIDPSALVHPTVAVLADRVLVTTLPSHAKRVVRRLLKDAPTEPTTFDRGRFPADASVVAFADWATFFGRIYASARVMAPMLAMGVELPFDLTTLPEAAVFTRFFGPSVRWNRRVEGGVLHHAESSFGPDVPLLVLVGFAALEAAVGGSGDEMDVDVSEAPPAVAAEGAPARRAREETLLALARVKVALQVFSFDQDAFPAELTALEVATAAFPDGFLDGGAVPHDAWGRALRYVRGSQGYELWSLGPDGIDDEGGGDDVRAH